MRLREMHICLKLALLVSLFSSLVQAMDHSDRKSRQAGEERDLVEKRKGHPFFFSTDPAVARRLFR